jgi:hypothetical protein
MTFPTAPRVLMLVIAASFFPFASHAQQKGGKENLLTNPSFQQGLDGWRIDVQKDTGNTVEVDKVELRDGRPTLKLTNVRGGDTHLFQVITVKPDTRYRMTAYIKTKDVSSVKRESGRPTGRGALLGVKGGANSKYIDQTRPWAKMELDFESGGATEMMVGPGLGVYFDAVTGTAWFADLTLVEMGRARK